MSITTCRHPSIAIASSHHTNQLLHKQITKKTSRTTQANRTAMARSKRNRVSSREEEDDERLVNDSAGKQLSAESADKAKLSKADCLYDDLAEAAQKLRIMLLNHEDLKQSISNVVDYNWSKISRLYDNQFLKSQGNYSN